MASRSRSRTTSPARARRTPRQARPDSARAARAFTRLVAIMATLRAPDGCAWDRKQTHRSLRPYLIEEAYEALDAIDRGRWQDLPEELGDVLLQCVFHAQIGFEHGRFEIADVVERVAAKLVARHPHVFDAKGRPLSAAARRKKGLSSPSAVIEQWARIKARERASAGTDDSVLAGVPRSLPALARAHRIGSRAAGVGFDWPEAAGVLDKIEEEVRELRAAIAEGAERTADEMGDVLFSIANLSRKLGVDPEHALTLANDKFTDRFRRLESHLRKAHVDVHHATPDQLEAAWTAIKAEGQDRKRRPSRSARTTSGPTPPSRRSRR